MFAAHFKINVRNYGWYCHAEKKLILPMQILNLWLYDTAVVSGSLPDMFPEAISEHCLEASIIWSAALIAGFLEIILQF